MKINPFLLTDGYKVGHHKMYPKGTTLVYSNFTPRSNKYAPKGIRDVVSFGQQMVMRYIHDVFSENFFGGEIRYAIEEEMAKNDDYAIIGKELLTRIKDDVIGEIKEAYSQYLGEDYDVSHIEALWDLGYLPIKVKALPEGTTVPMGVPVLTIYNTKDEFFWLTNFLETIISTLLWKPITSATIAKNFYGIISKYANETDKGNPALRYLGHDFSMRGMDAPHVVGTSGMGHALFFDGSDSLPVIAAAKHYYNATGNIINSVNATEHSVMCAGEKDTELETFMYLMKQFPKGILSIVSDTWDLWTVLTVILPKLREEILKRDGKIVIRPDSGDPVDIICGTINYPDIESWEQDRDDPMVNNSSEQKGVVELLWDVFGGTINEDGYKVLDPHIGAIYGDSINDERAVAICERLKAKGFASTNVILGVGSFTYQFNTRDTFGFAMKATYCEIMHEDCCEDNICRFKNCEFPGCEGYHLEGREIFKDPITDDGTKKSARGLLKVHRIKGAHGYSEYQLKDKCSWEEESEGELIPIYVDGKAMNEVTFEEIRNRVR